MQHSRQTAFSFCRSADSLIHRRNVCNRLRLEARFDFQFFRQMAQCISFLLQLLVSFFMWALRPLLDTTELLCDTMINGWHTKITLFQSVLPHCLTGFVETLSCSCCSHCTTTLSGDVRAATWDAGHWQQLAAERLLALRCGIAFAQRRRLLGFAAVVSVGSCGCGLRLMALRGCERA